MIEARGPDRVAGRRHRVRRLDPRPSPSGDEGVAWHAFMELTSDSVEYRAETPVEAW